MDGQDFFYAKTTALPFLQGWSISELNQLKYILTVLFSLWFMFISLVGAKASFSYSIAYKLLAVFYILLCLIALIGIFFGISIFDYQTIYPFLRKIIGVIHNPLPYLLISIGVYGINQIQENTNWFYTFELCLKN